MAFQIPPMPPELVEALKRPMLPPSAAGMPVNGRPGPTMPGPLPTGQPATPPIRMGPGGVNLSPQPPGVNAAGIPSAPAPTGTTLPPVTDDPAVTGSTGNPMGAMPKPVDLGSYLNPALNQYKSDLSGYQKADEGSRIDPNAMKPRLWERLLGGVVGGISGNAQVGQDITHRRLNQAEKSRDIQLKPWTQRLELDKAGAPLAESAAHTAFEQGELGLRTAAEGRERFTAEHNANSKDEQNANREEFNDIRRLIGEGKHDEAEQKINETAERNKNNLDLQRQILDLRRDALDAKEANGGKPKAGQVTATENSKSQAIAKAHAQYSKATQGLPTDPKATWTEEQKGQLEAAKEAYDQATQDAQDAYEAKVNETGGTATHQDVTRDPAWTGKGQHAATPGTQEEALPTVVGPAGEKPVKTGNGGQFGYYKSTGQWMRVPTQEKK